MNKVTKKLLSVMLALAMVFSVATANQVKAEETTTVASTTSTVTFTVERFTIGQGYLVEPVQVTISSVDTAASVFEKVMQDNGITYDSGVSTYGFYLNSIDNADTGAVNIPKEISAMESVSLWGSDYNPPSNDSNDGNSLENNALGSYSYNSMAGWMFMVNNADPGEAADSVSLQDGDVIRLQFSVYGWGADIGFDGSYYGFSDMGLANKDDLTKEVAAVNANSAELLGDAGIKAAYDNAMVVLQTYSVSQDITDSALKVLQQAEATYEAAVNATTEETTTAEETTIYPTVAKAKISKITNVKTRKAKIKVKKVDSATGYQFTYANNKKFKNAATKTTTKTTFKTKKFKKKETCYVKVRAYVKVNGTRVYGKWSKVKKVKIRK